MEQRNHFLKFVVFIGIALLAIEIGFVEANVPATCNSVPKSYCLDCLNFAMCDNTVGSYTPIPCPSGKVCTETSTTTIFCSETDLDYCRCSGTTFPSTKTDYYDVDKAVICLSATSGPYIECKDGLIYNDLTATCDAPIKTTLYPATVIPTVACNNKAEFICLGCDFYQVCVSDNTAQTYACDANTLCNEPAKKCIPTKFTCDTAITPAGYQGDPYNCTVYYYCEVGDPVPYIEKTCPEGQVFVVASRGCEVNPEVSSKCLAPYDCTADVTTQIQITTTTNTPSSCPCSSTIQTCKIDCRRYYYCYEDPPGTFTPIEKVCPYDFIFNPSTEKCESGTCVNRNKMHTRKSQIFNPHFVILD